MVGNRSVPMIVLLSGWLLWIVGMMPAPPPSLGRKGHDRCCLTRTLILSLLYAWYACYVVLLIFVLGFLFGIILSYTLYMTLRVNL